MSDTTTFDRKTADTDTVIDNTRGAPVALADNPPKATPPRKRKLLLALLGMAVAASGAAYGAYYMTYARYHQSTDDAYVSGNLVQLTPQVTGTVVAINADDTQIVKQGDPVVTLDGADAKVSAAERRSDARPDRAPGERPLRKQQFLCSNGGPTRGGSRSRQRRSAPA